MNCIQLMEFDAILATKVEELVPVPVHHCKEKVDQLTLFKEVALCYGLKISFQGKLTDTYV